MKKVILYKNEQAVNQAIKRASEATNDLNNFIARCENEFKTTFNDIEKFELLNNGATFIKEKVKAKYPFPDATDEFNQKALNIDANSLINIYTQRSNFFQSYKFKLNKKGQFELDGEQKLITQHYRYLENDRQKKAFDLANQLSELINETNKQGFIENRLLGSTSELNLEDLIKTEREGMIHKITPNKYRISMLK